METIVFKDVSFKNFLSYGNNWQTIKFTPGMTLVQGVDTDTEKSNGSGKSSAMETIPFALFGQTMKSVKKDEIVNRINKKGCEVRLTFEKGTDTFEIHRGIKPSKFKVFKNGDEIQRIADVKVFQEQVEQEIIGMDFRTFKMLIYFRPNNNESIIDIKKDQKRKFLESLFDLEVYSKMLVTVNEKLKNIKDSQAIRDNDIVHFNNEIDTLLEDVKKPLPNLIEYKKKVNFITLQLDGLTQNPVIFNDTDYQRVLLYIGEIEKTRDSILAEISELNNEKTRLNAIISTIDVQAYKDLSARIDISISKLKEREEFKPSFEYDDLSASIEKYNNDIDELVTNLSILKTNKAVSTEKLKGLQIELKKVSVDAGAVSGAKDCPLCKQSVNHEHIASWEASERDRLTILIDDLSKEISDTDTEVKSGIDTLTELRDGLQKCAKEKARKDAYDKESWEILHKINVFEEKRKMLPDIVELEKKLADANAELSVCVGKIDTLQNENLYLNGIDLETQKAIKLGLEDELALYNKYLTNVQNLEKELVYSTDNLKDMEQVVKDQQEGYNKKNERIEEIKALIKETNDKTRKQNAIKDYLEYLRLSLKDENVKQYAISTFVPYINNKANHYLMKSGFPYTIVVDGWLDVIVKGMSSEDVSYSSLSGGEGKAIDTSIQLACNDLAARRAKTKLSLMIYDEILDSSLDEQSIGQLMEIISVRQKENKDSVFVITHRSELKDLNFDGNLFVKKSNGFTTIIDSKN